MITHNLVQGSPEWRQYRLQHFGASEAAAMLGLSTRMKRNELLHMKATGTPREFSDWVQERVLDRGHEVEALARPHVEAMIGEDLYQQTVSDGRLSASTDGLTLGDDIAWEHKLWNDALAESVRAGIIPDEHMPQCQQVLMLTRAKKLIFTVSDGTPERMLHVEAKPDKDWFARLHTGWKQFAADLAAYKAPPAAAPAPVAAVIHALPALMVNVEGKVTASNLDAFKASAEAFLANISTDLTTDQHFADAEKTVKFCKEGEERLELVKAQALEQTATIDELFRAIDHIKEQLRAKRLALDKLVTTRKADMRAEIVTKAQAALNAHVVALNTRLGEQWIPHANGPFAEAIKGLKSLDSIQNAADTALANAKIAANARADQLERNRKALMINGKDWMFLFADFTQAGIAASDVFDAVAAKRINAHQDAEAEAARKAEAAAKAEADRRAVAAAAMPPPPPPPPPPSPAAPAPEATQTITASQDTRPPISTGEIGKRLGFILQVSFIEEVLGVTHSSQDKRAMLWRESDWPAIKAALVRHIGGLL